MPGGICLTQQQQMVDKENNFFVSYFAYSNSLVTSQTGPSNIAIKYLHIFIISYEVLTLYGGFHEHVICEIALEVFFSDATNIN